jgi:two-component system cell cycle sensor histidine kinase/response regulator CckA
VINFNHLIIDYLASPEHQKFLENHGGVTILTRLCPEPLHLEGSPLHLKNAVMNLVFNSVEAGADQIVLSTDNRYVEPSLAADQLLNEGEYVLFSIQDNGSGISKESQARIFEPFYTKKRMGRSGTGLGMAVVWGTVKDHGGTITIDSDTGQPTTFDLLFPATRRPLPSQQPAQTGQYTGNGQKVLVVDDSRDQRQIAQAALEALGYGVQTAAGGEEALRLLEDMGQPWPDVILLDMLMEPGMDGLDTYQRIRALNSGQRVIIVSGYSETGRVKEALALGARRYLRKPYLLNGLSEALHQVLADPRQA